MLVTAVTPPPPRLSGPDFALYRMDQLFFNICRRGPSHGNSPHPSFANGRISPRCSIPRCCAERRRKWPEKQYEDEDDSLDDEEAALSDEDSDKEPVFRSSQLDPPFTPTHPHDTTMPPHLGHSRRTASTGACQATEKDQRHGTVRPCAHS